MVQQINKQEVNKKKNSQGSDPDVAEVVGAVPLNSMEPRGLMLAKDLAPNTFPAASLSLGCCQEVNTVIVEWESIYIIIYLYIPIFKEHFATSTFVIFKSVILNQKYFRRAAEPLE